MAKNTIKLTEQDLHNVIMESVKQVLEEQMGYGQQQVQTPQQGNMPQDQLNNCKAPNNYTWAEKVAAQKGRDPLGWSALEEEVEEGFWNQIKSAANTFTGDQKPGQGGLYNRFNNARQNFQAQGNLDKFNDAAKTIVEYMNSNGLDWDMPVGKVLNKIMGKRLSMAKQMKGRGGKGYFKQ